MTASERHQTARMEAAWASRLLNEAGERANGAHRRLRQSDTEANRAAYAAAKAALDAALVKSKAAYAAQYAAEAEAAEDSAEQALGVPSVATRSTSASPGSTHSTRLAGRPTLATPTSASSEVREQPRYTYAVTRGVGRWRWMRNAARYASRLISHVVSVRATAHLHRPRIPAVQRRPLQYDRARTGGCAALTGCGRDSFGKMWRGVQGEIREEGRRTHPRRSGAGMIDPHTAAWDFVAQQSAREPWSRTDLPVAIGSATNAFASCPDDFVDLLWTLVALPEGERAIAMHAASVLFRLGRRGSLTERA